MPKSSLGCTIPFSLLPYVSQSRSRNHSDECTDLLGSAIPNWEESAIARLPLWALGALTGP